MIQNFKNYINKSFLVFGIYVLVATIIFGKLTQTFFQQDEWLIFGNYLYWDKAGLDWLERLFIFQQYTHLIPLSNFLSYLQFKFFALNFFPYALVSITLQILNAFLVYYLTRIITKKNEVSFIAGLLFIVYSISDQAITWVATTTGTAGAVFFGLLSIIFLVKFVISRKTFNILMSSLLLLVSLFFKETSIFLFLFLPIFWLFFEQNKNIKKFFVSFLPFLITGFIYVIIRLYFLLTATTQAVQGSISQPSLPVFIFRFLTVPLKFFAQGFVPSGFILDMSNLFVSLQYPQFNQGGVPDPYISQSIGVDIFSYEIAILIGIICFLTIGYFSKKRGEQWRKLIIMSCVFIGLSSLPLILVPGAAGYFSIVDGRHLYFTGVFISILLSILLYRLYLLFPNKKLGFIIVSIIAGIVVGMHIMQIRRDINYQVGTAIIRKSILNEISRRYPVLPKNVIFYFESDKSYYGLPENEKILPFQSGLGQTLLVWYNNKGENFPACFFKDQFLYELLSVGYRNCGGRGFGYFRNLEDVKKAMKDNNLTSKNVIGIRYNSSDRSLTDISLK